MTPEEQTAFDKRRRARSWAIMLTLIGLVLLFYFIAMARIPRAIMG
jgi:hypothetical protein